MTRPVILTILITMCQNFFTGEGFIPKDKTGCHISLPGHGAAETVKNKVGKNSKIWHRTKRPVISGAGKPEGSK